MERGKEGNREKQQICDKKRMKMGDKKRMMKEERRRRHEVKDGDEEAKEMT